MKKTDNRSVDEMTRDMIRASNKYDWCNAHCERTVNRKWDSVTIHRRDCPWLSDDVPVYEPPPEVPGGTTSEGSGWRWRWPWSRS